MLGLLLSAALAAPAAPDGRAPQRPGIAPPAIDRRAADRSAVEQSAAPVDIGSRREPFVDRFLIDRMEGAGLRLAEPRLAGVALRFDAPWEGRYVGYPTVLLDGGVYRLYYRGWSGVRGNHQVTCYAESRDGRAWTKPKLGLIEYDGSKENNILLDEPALVHNFSPFVDARPGVPPAERLKAVAGEAKTGLFALASGDGVRWRRMQSEAVFRQGAFDSQNVAFWSAAEGKYLLYFRVFTGGKVDAQTWKPSGYRSVARTTSDDFLHWSAPAAMEFGDAPWEHLYTNQTHPYFRAPHVYVALPMRFMPGRQVLTDEQAVELDVPKGYARDCAETVLMTSRGGNRYDRTFLEGFIRPGLDPGNWASRAGIAALGIVPTGPAEMSLYKQAHYTQPTAHLLRYSLRTDGLASLHAPFAGGSMLTRPLVFAGKSLEVNFSTGAAGGIRVEITDAGGAPLAGYTLAEATELVGDQIARTVRWKGGADVAALAGRPVRLRFTMKDADLYSLRFVP